MFKEVWIERKVPDSFRKLVPEYFDAGISLGEISGIGFYDDFYDEPVVAGVVLFRIRNTWLEIVWTGESDAFEGGSTTADMLKSCIIRMSDDKRFTGIFAEFPESDTALYEAFRESGFTVDRAGGGVFEFEMSMVQRALLTGTDKYRPFCCNLGNADFRKTGELEAALKRDKRDLPVSLPIDYSEYDPFLSYIYLNGVNYGLLLSKREKDYVSLEVVISQNPTAFMTMMAAFVEGIDRLGVKNRRIFIPVVSREAESLIKKIVPEARENEVFQAYLYQ